MNLPDYIDQIKKIQKNLLEFIENESDNEENFNLLAELLDYSKIRKDKPEFKLFFHLLMQIVRNHIRETGFFGKIFKIILFLKDDILNSFSNLEIFNIFHSNKRIILFLIEEKIVNIDQLIINRILTLENQYYKYHLNLFPEIKPFIQKKIDEKCNHQKDFEEFIEKYKNIYENEEFYRNREIGENETELCRLIREDLIKEFIIYVNETSISLKKAIVQSSIYETHSFLFAKNPTLIEYATFFQSNQVFQYLIMNGVELTPSLWIYAIHGKNSEVIHILEDNHIEPEDQSYMKCLKEAMKCHHNEYVEYFLVNYLQNNEEEKNECLNYSIKYYNFAYIQPELITQKCFHALCQKDYFYIVKFLLNTFTIDINSVMIHLEWFIKFYFLDIHVISHLILYNICYVLLK